MKTMILAAAAVLSLGTGAAFADGGEGPAVNTQFTSLPGVVAQANVTAPSAVAQLPQAHGPAAFVTLQRHTVTAFPWNPNEGVGG